MTEYAFVIERPNSMPQAPQYLSYEGNNAYRKFCWREGDTFALRFARQEDAEQVAAVSKTFQPELWQETKPIGAPRIAEHGWDVPA